MKDSQNSSEFNLIQTAVLLPLVALLAIVAGAFLGDGIVQAQESVADGISSETHENYFSEDVDKGGQLAQSGGLLESRSDADAEDEQVSESAEVDECSTVYIEDDLRIDFDNDPESVLKLQSFLKTFEGYDAVSLTGEFDETTLEAVMSFQTRYAEEILEPWGYLPNEATGYVYITTKKQINEIYCDEQFALSREQQEEIREYREMLNQWRSQGASFETPNYLAEYYGNATPPAVAGDNDMDDAVADDADVEGDDDSQDDAATTSTSTATSTDDEEDTDDRNFFQRLFGIGGEDDDDTATTTATSTDSATSTDDEDADAEDDGVIPTDDEDEVTATDDESATSATNTTATGSIDGVASGVYNGINSIFNFLLSPTFLLIVLVVLILLLIATVIEGDGELDDDESDIDPWAEYDETQDADDDTNSADETDDDKTTDTEAPTPPDKEGSSDDTSADKGNDSKDTDKKQN